jgi:hypothetical protein
LIQSSTTGMVFLITDGQKRRYIYDPQSLNSHNFNRPICVISESAAQGYSPRLFPDLRAREGTLFNAGSGAVYIVERDPTLNYWKRWILSADSFNYYGLSWSAIQGWPGAIVNSYSETVHVHPIKSLFAGRWYQQLVCDFVACDYSGWITLREDRQYPIPCNNCVSVWTPHINGALGTWNSRPTTARFTSQPQSSANEVHFSVTDYPDAWQGEVAFYDPNSNHCGRPPTCATFQSVWVRLNNRTNDSIPVNERQITAEHELGHAIGLAHDGLNDPPGEVSCGPLRFPRTVMDYDCMAQGYGVQPWDSCGVNHAYPDPGWGWSGC